jgi:hypothetical protein
MGYYVAKVLVYIPDTEAFSMGTQCDEIHFVNGAINWEDGAQHTDVFKDTKDPIRSYRMWRQLYRYERVDEEFAEEHWNDLFTEEGGI